MFLKVSIILFFLIYLHLEGSLELFYFREQVWTLIKEENDFWCAWMYNRVLSGYRKTVND